MADDTGIPATCAIAQALLAHQRARVIVEVADQAAHQPIESPAASWGRGG
ncbi:hypothetical protein BH23ACT2_BH23ACT2_03710 [soil metagenome]